MSLQTRSRLVLAPAALLALPVAGGAQNQSPPPLESVRLLPLVLLKGEKAWSLGDRMRHRLERSRLFGRQASSAD